MMVTFISQCEKKALNKTRRVLDAFANRIGDRTWQTVITKEGLLAVKKLLRKTATKNTAVSCHWIRSRSRSELVWIVGNRGKFNERGEVAVNYTKTDYLNMRDETEWQYLPLIKALSALAALFHDWGKASDFFQYKLKQKGNLGDPLRHEWVTVLIFSEFVDKKSDEEWLQALIDEEIDFEEIANRLKAKATDYENGIKVKPFKNLPTAASLLGWLITSHHLLPFSQSNKNNVDDLSKFLSRISHDWGYQRQFGDDFRDNVGRCFTYSDGSPLDSKIWLQEVKKQARKLKANMAMLNTTMDSDCWRAVLSYARLALMLADHSYSSLPPDSSDRVKHQELSLIANTDKHNKPKQTLDEHLLGVYKHTKSNAHFLPAFSGQKFRGEEVMEWARDNKSLARKSSDAKYMWQDKAVKAIQMWRKSEKSLDSHSFGFFAVNMASTGTGKTIANAKIMRALSPDAKSLRYISALGLRTLTLQTGDEYRERLSLEKDDMAVLIGSKAIADLHNAKISENEVAEESFSTGSESEFALLDNELVYEGVQPVLEKQLQTVLRKSKDRKLLYSPVLVCTIDHIMGSVETKRGGKFILPTLRLMYSDLVIDEIDDFDGADLIAIGRLVHLAGMLGRKVMISSATISPDIAEGYFNAYQAGWRIFASFHSKNHLIGCAWIDEFVANVKSIKLKESEETNEQYRSLHREFIKRRVQSLNQQIVKRKGELIRFDIDDELGSESLGQKYFEHVKQAAIEQHSRHSVLDRKSGKKISFGIVRVANIKPCIELTRYLLNVDWGDDIDIRAMAYHSRQVLIMRNAQERHLDEVLRRKQGREAVFQHSKIREHIQNTEANNLIFILVATPVEEVGRDHCADWAIVEPSSYRSIIQLAGRVLRHQEIKEDIAQSNISLMQYNLRHIRGEGIAFKYPGYESNETKLETHDLEILLKSENYENSIDAQPRIERRDKLDYKNSLVDLEHEAIHRFLTSYTPPQNETHHLQHWLGSFWWLTANPQLEARFRNSQQSHRVYLYPIDDEWRFVEKDKWGEATDPVEDLYEIDTDESLTDNEKERLWLKRDYAELLEELGKSALAKTALIYGELELPVYDERVQPSQYSSQFGVLRYTKN